MQYDLPMMLRITSIKGESGTRLCIDGQLAGENVCELDRACQLAAAPFLIDLENLKSVDDAGLRALILLVRQGAKLHSVSGYIQMLLNIEG